MSSRESRREENQRTFRRANEAFHNAVDDEVADTRLVPFLCECADVDCFGKVNVTLSEWEVVTSRDNHFLMIAAHQRSAGEKVIGSLREYEVAEKPDEARDRLRTIS